MLLVEGCSFFFRVAWASWGPQVRLISLMMPKPIYMLCDCIFCLTWWRLLPFYYSGMNIAVSEACFFTGDQRALVFNALLFPFLNTIVLLPFVLLSITASLYKEHQFWRNDEHPAVSPRAKGINNLVIFSTMFQPQKNKSSLDQFSNFPDVKKSKNVEALGWYRGEERPKEGGLSKKKKIKFYYLYNWC